MRTIDAISALQARAPVDVGSAMQTSARPAPPAVQKTAESAGSQQSALRQQTTYAGSKVGTYTATGKPEKEYGPPDRDGNGWIDPPDPQEVTRHIDALM
jgi:hypothetical protein